MIIYMRVREIFAKRLKELRESMNISQRELARRVQISAAMVSDYEAGKRSPTIEVVEKLANFFNVSTDYLLGLTDNPQPWSNDLPESVRKQLEEYQRLKEKYEEILGIIDLLHKKAEH